MSDVTISTKDNGPLLVTGSVTLSDGGGGQYITENEIIALCRCGASANKPFCDGSHSTIGFSAAGRVTG